MATIACPCGEDHSASPVYRAVQGFADRLGENVRLTVSGTTWEVPRIWIAFHGLAAADLPALAKKHGWSQVSAAAAEGSR